MRRMYLGTIVLICVLLFTVSGTPARAVDEKTILQWPLRGSFAVTDAYDAKDESGILLSSVMGPEPVSP